MRIVSLLIVYLLLVFSNQRVDSPHGPDFKISCSSCHSSKSWALDMEIYSFDHNTTRLPLIGRHTEVNCRQCHTSLVFSEAGKECIQCHQDIHQSTTGADCSQCHTPASWLVNNISDIHRLSRFPLLGAHRTADCFDCHKSESHTRFDVPGVNCIDCHRENYLATTNPNHIASGLSEDCVSCHLLSSFQWAGAGFDHSKFPLIQGHSTPLCSDCHTSGSYLTANPECNSCHQPDYQESKNPDHNAAGFSINCTECHNLKPGWKPTTYDHSKFALTLGHADPLCIDCHIGEKYTNTPVDCNSCHQKDYIAATNPNHIASNLPTDCESCHTTTPGWKPATFDHSKFPLTLGHAAPSCVDCHKGNYTSTSTECYSCHQLDYNSSINPNHQALGFSTNCTECHTTNPGWKPASYKQHDTQFPIYSGAHSGKWNSCTECHENPSSYSQYTCVSCHEHNKTEMDDKHQGRSGYIYNSINCFDCHPRGRTD